VTTTYPAYRGLRFEEEYALEQMFRSAQLTVPDAQGRAIPVDIFWKDPQRELHQMRYPAIMLEFLDMVPRRNEEVRGIVDFYTEPYTANYLPNNAHTRGEFPLPVLLYYQATVYSRVQQHDVILNDMMATTFIPVRYGQLNCPSGTNRRLDFESMSNRDTLDGNNQRVYAKLWAFSISAEIMLTQNPSAVPAGEFDIKVTDTTTGYTDPTIIDKL
jgi:hypothetical protein